MSTNPLSIFPDQLKNMLSDGQELALLDVREQGRFAADGHLLLACSLPLSTLELGMADLVPHRNCRVVLCDGGEGLAEQAAEKLAGFGYTALHVLEGGSTAWREAGYQVFTGINVPSKAFGEFVEKHYGTASISAEELQGLLEQGKDLVVVDSRPLDEYEVMNIPTGIDVPGAELALRIHDIAPRPETLVVVNCAGRTRSIIGAQSLINAGIPNKVVDLRNGTMGWHLSGFPLEHGSVRTAPEPSPEGLQKARACAARVAARFRVREISAETLAAWQGAKETLYVLDVRHLHEYEKGHLPGSRPAPGGQLVQATDEYMATRHARVVLVDDNGIRATMTASWLLQMGRSKVHVLAGGLTAPGLPALQSGPYRPLLLGGSVDVPTLSPTRLREAKEDVLVLDLGQSRNYLKGHIPQARFALRSRLSVHAPRLPAVARIVLTSDDGLLARLAVAELAPRVSAPVAALEGGTGAWREAGYPLENGKGEGLDDLADDVVLKPYHHEKAFEAQAMREYLSWEIDLMTQIDRDGDLVFEAFL